MSRLLGVVALVGLVGWSGCSGESEDATSTSTGTRSQPTTGDESPTQSSGTENGGNEDILVAEESTDDTTAPNLDETEIDPGVPDFESLMDDAFEGDFAEFDDFDFGFDEDQPLPPFDAVTLDEFDASWKTSFTASGEPAGELLSRLASECGFTLEDQPELTAALETPVNFELVDVNRLQIIEEICSQAGFYPRYRLDRIKLSPGPRPLPVAFVGPFLIEARDLQEQVPYGTGSISVQLTGCTMSQDANSWLQQQSDDFGAPLAVIDSVLGTGEADLMDAEANYVENPTATAQVVRFRMTQNLKGLLRGVEQIEQIGGTIDFTLPGEVVAHTFEELAVGQSGQLGDMKVELNSVNLGSDSTIGLTTTGGSLDNLVVTAFDADGNSVDVNGHFKTDFGDSGELQFFLTGTPATILVRSVTATLDTSYPFELVGIPLQHASEMPESIEPLTFAGDMPVTLTYLRIQKDQFQNENYVVEAVNHSNKDLSFVHVNVFFLDANGAELGSFPHSQGGFPVVAANATGEIEVSTFFAPEGTVSIRPELVEVRSMDTMTWKAPE